MQSPNSPRTRETERRMLLWRQRYPQEGTRAYNAEYARTYESLTDFSDKEDQPSPGFAEAFATSQATMDPYPPNLVASSDDYVKPVEYRRRKHGPQTKGAFGKPKPYHYR